ncbi:MAG: glycogen synthase, partial [Loktanella sp.]|nr:glycogen synthase [Loktanella sp.]
VPTVLTIHNIAFQGVFPSSTLATLDLPDFAWRQDVGEFWGKFSFLKCGLMLADRITTVSPTYAAELMSPDFGMGLDGVMRDRRDVLSGIVNGIDLDVWNPETDPAIPQTYTSRTLRKKAVNTAALRERFGLEDSTGPLFCVISRLTTQKGLDLLLEVLPALIDQGAQLALLGSGDKGMEHAYADAARRHAGQIGAIIGYDEDLSHLMQAGADGILVPSRFEPCGLTQLYALRYGTVPVVARTGGLADTIVDANIAAIDTGCGTGVQFTPVTALALEQAIARACALFQRKELWSGLQKRGMKQPVGWNASALAYLTLFKGLKNN